ncbi:MAG: hypothetical protein NXI31_25705 [bacterium]|nr:hypothetical protein [bacterium]
MSERSAEPHRIETLRRTLRIKAKEHAAVEVSAEDLLLLLDEVGRLGQSNDRLRRQNKRLRRRSGAGDAGDGGGGSDPDPSTGDDV